MTQRFTVTVTDLPPELSGGTGTNVLDYTADDGTTDADVEASVRQMLDAHARRVELDGFDSSTANITVTAL